MKSPSSFDLIKMNAPDGHAFRRQANQLRAMAQNFLDLAAQAQLLAIADFWQQRADESNLKP